MNSAESRSASSWWRSAGTRAVRLSHLAYGDRGADWTVRVIFRKLTNIPGVA